MKEHARITTLPFEPFSRGQFQWRPYVAGLGDISLDAAVASSLQPKEAQEPLWREAVAPDGRVYYW